MSCFWIQLESRHSLYLMANILKRGRKSEQRGTREGTQELVGVISNDAELLQRSVRLLGSSCMTRRFGSIAETIEQLAGQTPEVLLIDYRATEPRALIDLRRSEEFSQVPCVFLVGTPAQREEIGRVFGACDFLSLPLDPVELTSRLRHLIYIRREGAKYLSRSSNRTKFLEEGANVGTWEWNPASDSVEPSQALGQLLGDTVRGQARSLSSWLRFVESDDRERVESSYSALRCGEVSSHQIEYRIQGEGTVRWVQERARVLEWKDGVPSRVFAIVANDTERRASERRIVQLVNYDSLTALPNQNKCVQLLSQATELASVRSDMSCLLRVNLSGLARINGARGRATGDAVLRQAAERLKNYIQSPELISRFGGKEFALIRHGLSPDSAQAELDELAKDIREELEQRYLVGQEYFHCECQIGACMISEDATPEILIRECEIALNHASRTKRPFAVFEDSMMLELEERAHFVRDLERAVFTNEFQLSYQPIVDAKGAVFGVEGLARWHHPVRGVVPPPDFIDVAEETGMIIPLGVRLRRQACEQLARWSKDPRTAHLTISVNVSPEEFKAKSFVRDLLVLVKGLRVPRDRLYLELTEGILAGDLQPVALAMEQLRDAGVGLVLDDFGTGYSSLSYLRTLPFQRLKVDRSFVQKMLTSPRDAGLARTLLAMAENLELEAVVEGVEDEEQFAHLVKLGCVRFQGFYFAKPGTPEATEALARQIPEPQNMS